jgi:hypothetical protein
MKFRWILYIALTVFLGTLNIDVSKADDEFEVSDKAWQKQRDGYSFFKAKKPAPKEKEKSDKKKEKGNSTTERNFNDGEASGVLLWFFAILALLILGFIIFKLLSGKMNTRNKRINKKSTDVDLEDISDESLTSGDYKHHLKEVVTTEDYREAIRMRFLLLLKVLQETGQIQWRNEKTNLDYLLVFSGTDHFKPFQELIWVFELTWYGERNVNSSDYAIVSKRFDAFHKSIMRGRI